MPDSAVGLWDLADALHRVAERDPDRLALVTQSSSMTYAELDADVTATTR